MGTRIERSTTGDDPTARVERSMLALFVAMRVGMLILGGLTPRSGRRRPTAASIVAWASVAGATAFVARRGFPRHDRRGMVTVGVDVVASAAALTLRAIDAPGEFDWTAGAAFWSAAAIGAPVTRVPAQVVAVTPLAAVYALVRTRSGGEPVRPMRVVQDTALLYVFTVAIGAVIRRMRVTADAIQSETDRAVVAAGEASKLEEVMRARDEFHVGAVAALGEIRARWHEDPMGARRLAAAEARRIRSWIEREPARAGASGGPLLVELDALVDALAADGVSIELITAEAPRSLEDDITVALVDTVRTAITAVSATGARFLVRVAYDDRLVVTIRSRGEHAPDWAAAMARFDAGAASGAYVASVVHDRLEIVWPR